MCMCRHEVSQTDKRERERVIENETLEYEVQYVQVQYFILKCVPLHLLLCSIMVYFIT